MLYMDLAMERVRKLQQVQHAAAGLLTGVGYKEYMTPQLAIRLLHVGPAEVFWHFPLATLCREHYMSDTLFECAGRCE